MRLFAASLATESNSFSPIPTNRASFEGTLYFRPGEHPDHATHCTAPLWVARRRARQEEFELVEGSCFWAEPSGPVVGADYEGMRDEILEQLEEAMPVDGALSWEVDWFDPDQRLVVLHALEPEDALAATASWLQGRGEPEPPHPGGWRRVAAWLRAGGPG